MILNVIDMLFGCWHKNYSFPITAKGDRRKAPAAQATGTYVVCLDCGKEFAYDWQAMKVVDSVDTVDSLVAHEQVSRVEGLLNKAA
jgi:hypothetical protein